ncbi:2,3-diaminopropionate biosynthesis protein SbnB [Herbidospora daliensis]|uniref:2,3-diaminopropionate biosynthesis protein SbnB n=1 Tax=Herbidospora daliensis TaxID=295585 RepID=UPI000785EAB1|nr:2,3-diaminopropionate biosynthesis protein SbnB [Herbidospora daliensis]
MLIIGGHDVEELLNGDEEEVLRTVRATYIAHFRERTSVPHSVFLRPDVWGDNRMIALPAFLQSDESVAGMKWIASFPKNVERGLARASGLIVLNSYTTGVPVAVLEGSTISAQRTAASAAIAAATLRTDRRQETVGLIGCGRVNAEVLHYLRHTPVAVKQVRVFDLRPDKAAQFVRTAAERFPDLDVAVSDSLTAVQRESSLLSIATTAAKPYLESLATPSDSIVLHISLRDLSPSVITSSNNIVDDSDHVCRERTSLQLAEEQTGGRRFIDRSLGELLADPNRISFRPNRPLIFSPFGLGVLDIAVAQLVMKRAASTGRGTIVADFLSGAHE